MTKRYEESISFAFYIPSRRASILFALLEKYINQAIVQYERIQNGKKDIDIKNLPTLFGDCHFYFICINKISELLFKFYDITGFEEIVDILENNKEYFKMYNEIRNHYEHIEERTISIKKEFGQVKRYLQDFGNMVNDVYTFGGNQYDISQNSINTLKKIYEDLIKIIKQHQESEKQKYV